MTGVDVFPPPPRRRFWGIINMRKQTVRRQIFLSNALMVLVTLVLFY